MAQITVQLNNLRIAPRKVRALTRLIKGKNADYALNQLEYYVKHPSLPLIKLIQSGLAGAEHNYQMVRSNLFIKEIRVDEGVKLKRFRPRAFGRVGEIQKKTSHVTIVLGERAAGLKAEAKTPAKTKKEVEMPEITEQPKEKKPEIKTEIGKKEKKTGFIKRIFQRKAV